MCNNQRYVIDYTICNLTMALLIDRLSIYVDLSTMCQENTMLTNINFCVNYTKFALTTVF